MKKKICIVIANYYPKVSKDLLFGVTSELKKIKNINIKTIYVPGIFEIPFVISKNLKFFDGFIALGCVIKGETPHFDFISLSTFSAIMDLSITYKKPIGNGIITCLNLKQSLERSNPNKKNKGGESAKALLSIL
jgi:6,7-dimethyl-8-ribityllumazine synthase